MCFCKVKMMMMMCMHACRYICIVMSVSIFFNLRYHDSMLGLMASGVEFDKMDGGRSGRHSLHIYINVYIYIYNTYKYVCVCVCVLRVKPSS